MPQQQSERTHGAFRYYNTNLKLLHTTSAPKNEQEAFAYVALIQKWFPGPSGKVRFIEQRGIADPNYVFMKLEIVDGKVVHHGTDSEEGSGS